MGFRAEWIPDSRPLTTKTLHQSFSEDVNLSGTNVLFFPAMNLPKVHRTEEQRSGFIFLPFVTHQIFQTHTKT